MKMVTICGRKFANTREKLLLSDIEKKKESKELEDFFAKLKEKREQRSKSRVLSGTSIPNSTFRSLHSGSKNENLESQSLLSTATISKESKIELAHKSDSKNRFSILSGANSTIEELKELRDLLHKSSYVPKKTSTRRPTIEKIRSAIAKEKKIINELNEAAIEVRKKDSVELSDASTSTVTGKKMKKKIKPRTSNNTSILNSPVVETSNRGTKKKRYKKKSNTKVDVQIQCSLYKIKS